MCFVCEKSLDSWIKIWLKRLKGRQERFSKHWSDCCWLTSHVINNCILFFTSCLTNQNLIDCKSAVIRLFLWANLIQHKASTEQQTKEARSRSPKTSRTFKEFNFLRGRHPILRIARQKRIKKIEWIHGWYRIFVPSCISHLQELFFIFVISTSSRTHNFSSSSLINSPSFISTDLACFLFCFHYMLNGISFFSFLCCYFFLFFLFRRRHQRHNFLEYQIRIHHHTDGIHHSVRYFFFLHT